MAVYTNLEKNEIENILLNYDLKLYKFFRIKKGLLNTNYFIGTNKGEFILRIFEGERKFEDENLELDFLLKIKNIIPCCIPLKTTTNKNYVVYKEKMIAIFEYIKGEPIKKINKKIIIEIANYLGKLHNFSYGKTLDRTSRIDLKYYYKNIDFNSIQISSKDKNIILEKYNLIKDIDFNILPSGIIHSDIFPDNILIDDKDNIVGILDFNESCTGPFIFDIAIIINFWIKIFKFEKKN